VGENIEKSLSKAKKEVPSILQDLIRIPSFNGELEIVNYLSARFEALNIPYHRRRLSDKSANINAYFGGNGRSLILNSHMDTVPPGDTRKWKYDPFEAMISNNCIYGLGAVDDKASLAAMVAAFEAIVLSKVDLNGKLILMAVGGEEIGGLGTQAEVKAGISADAVIIGEPTELEVCIAHKGTFRYKIKVLGKACHASRPKEGINAILKASKLVQALDSLSDKLAKKVDPLLGSPSLAVTTISGGKASNIIPGECTIEIDRRLLPGEEKEEAEKEILSILKNLQKIDSEFQFVTEFVRSIPPARVSSRELIVQTMLNSVAKVKGGYHRPLGMSGCCDMSFFSNWARLPAVICGPGKISMAHKVDEFIAIEDLKQAVEVYINAIMRWFRVK